MTVGRLVAIVRSCSPINDDSGLSTRHKPEDDIHILLRHRSQAFVHEFEDRNRGCSSKNCR